MTPDALAALNAALVNLRKFGRLAFNDDAVTMTMHLKQFGKFCTPIIVGGDGASEPGLASTESTTEPPRGRRGERKPSILAALERAEQPLTKRELAERAGVKANSSLVDLLRVLVEEEKTVLRLHGNRYWLKSRPLPAGERANR